jgi:hypothetical protein
LLRECRQSCGKTETKYWEQYGFHRQAPFERELLLTYVA